MSLKLRSCRVHFVGIGGIGMSGIAELLHGLGHKITGSDLHENDQVRRLRAMGVAVQIGHTDKILKEHRPDVLVYSNAVKADNAEWTYAREEGIPVIRRAEMLAELMRLKRGISVAGSHGKTTTTAMISFILKESGREPTVVIGGAFKAIGSNAAWGGGEWLVAEADESDGSFLHLSPEIAVVTNIDYEHMDHYSGLEELQKTFLQVIERVPFYGKNILCCDSPLLYDLKNEIRKPALWYGFEKRYNSFFIEVIEDGACPHFEVQNPDGEKFFETQLMVPGRHNVLNAVAAALVCRELGVDRLQIAEALSRYEGVARRFEKRGTWRRHILIDDYGHHPTEILATLTAAKAYFPNEKILVVFQPHRYSRTRLLWKEFQSCFRNADSLVTLPIYAGGESKKYEDEMIDGENFLNNVDVSNKHFAPNFAALKNLLEEISEKESFGPVIFLGAGDITKFISSILTEE